MFLDNPQFIKNTYIFSEFSTSNLAIIANGAIEDKVFNVKRVYFLRNMKSEEIRGEHAHIELKQVIFVLNGQVSIEILTKFNQFFQFSLNEGGDSLYIPELSWKRIISQSDKTDICVLASDIYKEEDYIRDFNDFKKMVQEFNKS